MRWAIKLSAFNITFSPTTTIKRQVVADFLVKSTHDDPNIPLIVEVDGSKCSTKSRIGINIQSPNGKNCEHSFRLFHMTNNMAEYEAVFHGLKMLHGMEPKNATIITYS